MQSKEEISAVKALIRISRSVIFLASIAIIGVMSTLLLLFLNGEASGPETAKAQSGTLRPASGSSGSGTGPEPADVWHAPDAGSMPAGRLGDSIRYGGELIARTGDYFGPKGSVAQISNGMNCQNCHLDGGRRLFANNYASFIANYPKMSGRSGSMETPVDRVLNCFERSLAGKAPDTSRKEIQSILAYMRWIGQGVKGRTKLFGSATGTLPYLDHAADPNKGREVFVLKCQSCHGSQGEGMPAPDKKSYMFPPLWGPHSYNDGAGMYRIGNLAAFVKNNMPFGTTYQNPQLTDEEAWNVAAFINSQPRPHKDQRKDWPKADKKPIDFPFGPYADAFSERQHKYGPFKPIQAAQKTK